MNKSRYSVENIYSPLDVLAFYLRVTEDIIALMFGSPWREQSVTSRLEPGHYAETN